MALLLEVLTFCRQLSTFKFKIFVFEQESHDVQLNITSRIYFRPVQILLWRDGVQVSSYSLHYLSPVFHV